MTQIRMTWHFLFFNLNQCFNWEYCLEFIYPRNSQDFLIFRTLRKQASSKNSTVYRNCTKIHNLIHTLTVIFHLIWNKTWCIVCHCVYIRLQRSIISGQIYFMKKRRYIFGSNSYSRTYISYSLICTNNVPLKLVFSPALEEFS